MKAPQIPRQFSLKFFVAALISIFGLMACVSSDDPDPEPQPSECLPLTNADVESGTTLPEDTCYVAESALTVADGTLYIEPGVIIYFPQNSTLSIQPDGRLNAAGREDAPIQFLPEEEGAENGYWVGIYFEGSNSPENLLDHVVIKDAGSDQQTGSPDSVAALYVAGGDPSSLVVTNTTFDNSGGKGFFFLDVNLTFENNTVKDSAIAGWLDAHVAGQLGDGNNFETNDDNRIHIPPSDVLDAATWKNHGIPYYVLNRVRANNELTLDPGVIIEFNQDAVFIIDGGEASLNATGTADEPIILRGDEPTPGYWSGLYLDANDTGENVFDYVTIENGGSSKLTGNNESQTCLFTGHAEASRIRMTNSTLTGCGLYGFHFGEDTVIDDFSNNVISDSERAGFVGVNVAGGIADTNVFENNVDNRIYLPASTPDTSVSQTWLALQANWYAQADVRFLEGASLTLAPGTTIEFAQGVGIEFNEATLTAVGNMDSPITLRSADPSNSWQGLGFTTTLSDDNRLEYVTLENAGGEPFTGNPESQAAIWLDGSGPEEAARLNVENVTINGSARHGFALERHSELTGCGVTFMNITASEFYLYDDATGCM